MLQETAAAPGIDTAEQVLSRLKVMADLDIGDEKIITIEDPVEYELPGVLQIPINDKKGLTFARGLRSILRHDPDKILVDQIRDGETAGIAVQAALTGHLVLTSVHANNVFSVLDRFLHMGVDMHSFVDALLGAVAQRLMRKSCPHCTRDDALPDDALLRASGLTHEAVADWRFRARRGLRDMPPHRLSRTPADRRGAAPERCDQAMLRRAAADHGTEATGRRQRLRADPPDRAARRRRWPHHARGSQSRDDSGGLT